MAEGDGIDGPQARELGGLPTRFRFGASRPQALPGVGSAFHGEARRANRIRKVMTYTGRVR